MPAGKPAENPVPLKQQLGARGEVPAKPMPQPEPEKPREEAKPLTWKLGKGLEMPENGKKLEWTFPAAKPKQPEKEPDTDEEMTPRMLP